MGFLRKILKRFSENKKVESKSEDTNETITYSALEIKSDYDSNPNNIIM